MALSTVRNRAARFQVIAQRGLALLALTAAVLAPSSSSALSLRQENFESPSDGTNYVVFGEHYTDEFTDEYFYRSNNVAFAFTFAQPMLGLHGSYFWAGEDTDFDGPGECRVTLGTLDVRGFQNLRVTWAAGTARDAGSIYESSDYMILQTALDGGAWTNLDSFRGPASSGLLRRDVNKDNIGEGTALTHTFADFTNTVSGIGTGLNVRVLFYMRDIDEEATFDDIRIAGDAIIPSIAITNPPTDIAVLGTVTNYNVQGTANQGVVWSIVWTNSGTKLTGTIPASTNWTIPNLALSPGLNTITVTGTNTVGNLTNASVVINRVLPPALAITAPSAATNVDDTVTAINLAGTANAYVAGQLTWTNSLTGATGTAAAATNWTISGVPLGFGTNLITVTGTNIVLQSTNATVSVYRVPAPVVTITSPPASSAVSHLVTTTTLTGTANDVVLGQLQWTNSLTGGAGAIPATTNWTISGIPLGLGTNDITVTGSNLVNRLASASVQVYRVPAPVLTITNPPASSAVSDLVTTTTVSGTANSVVLGQLQWTNSLTGAAGAVPASTNWSIPAIALAFGTNTITVTGSNIVQQLASATVSVYRVPAPVVTITSPPASSAVSHLVTTTTLTGTANDVIFGQLQWTNSLTGGAGAIPATTNWTISGIPLGLGTNDITVTGSNLVNRLASANVQIYRVPAPALTITNPPASSVVSDLVTTTTVSGTANSVVLGQLQWTNSLTGASGTVPASTNWSISGIALAFGTNTITVTGSNIVQQLASATVSVYRVRIPALVIVSPPSGTAVADDVLSADLSGTTGIEAFGQLQWTNALTGGAGAVPAATSWSILAVPLGLGTNAVTVTASNIVGRSTNTTVQIYRVPAPVVVITSPPASSAVSHLVTTSTLTGTANDVVTGLLRWTNALNGASGTVPATTNWTISGVPLAFGTNTITVTGSNIVNRLSSPAVQVYRVPAPLVTITNPAASSAVSDLVTSATLSGTANSVVVGQLSWTNSLTGATGTVPAATNWTIAGVALGFGTNTITVTGSNIVLQTSSALVSIYRVPLPALVITNPPAVSSVSDLVTTITLSGTASAEAAGLRWTNALNGASGSAPAGASWSIANIPLAFGTNVITVNASNIVNRTVTAGVSVFRVPAPVLTITDPATPITVAAAVSTRSVSGTANAVVIGQLTWTNALSGATGTLPAGTNWLAAALPLAPGVNVITVSGTNEVGRLASAQATIAREGAILLNELLVNPVGTNVTDKEFVELLQPSGGGSASDLSLVQLSGVFSNMGLVLSRWDLTGRSFGTNGLLLVGDNYDVTSGGSWSNLVSAHTGFADGGAVPDALSDTAMTLLLVRNCQPAVFAGADLDANNDGVLDSAPWDSVLDSVGWPITLADVVYSPARLGQDVFSTDAATRFPTNRVPMDGRAWYYGRVTTNLTDTLGRTYNTNAFFSVSTNLPAGAVLTPGRLNFPSATDADNDGLPNSWEQQYFGSQTGAAPGADPDGDGMSNLAEYWAGTNPTNAASIFTVDDMQGVGTTVIEVGGGVTQTVLIVQSNVLSWDSLPNRLYTILGKTNMTGAYTTLQSNVAATPPINTYTNPIGLKQQFYYRINVLEPLGP